MASPLVLLLGPVELLRHFASTLAYWANVHTGPSGGGPLALLLSPGWQQERGPVPVPDFEFPPCARQALVVPARTRSVSLNT